MKILETDWETIVSKPALADPTVPVIGRMYEAMDAAAKLSGTMPALPSDRRYRHPCACLPRAVRAFQAAWDEADRHAVRVGQQAIPPRERHTINQVRSLLRIAENSAASNTERQNAYQRAHKLIRALEHTRIPARDPTTQNRRHPPTRRRPRITSIDQVRDVPQPGRQTPLRRRTRQNHAPPQGIGKRGDYDRGTP